MNHYINQNNFINFANDWWYSLNIDFLPIIWYILMSIKFKLNQEVLVTTKDIPEKRGVVRYIGKI